VDQTLLTLGLLIAIDAETIPLGPLEDLLAKLAQAQPDVLFVSALPPSQLLTRALYAEEHAKSALMQRS
jgi:hypothetical protein